MGCFSYEHPDFQQTAIEVVHVDGEVKTLTSTSMVYAVSIWMVGD